MILERINKTDDIKNLTWDELDTLAVEIREFLVQKVSEKGGHLASNLGAVELTIALHKAFSLPKDKLIWDVGHQAYTHKLLSGRRDGFDTLRELGGMSGFPKRNESECDAFDTGHSSTSISAGLGYVEARELNHENYKVVSIIGDGAFTGGLAYEALNNASHLDKNFIIILNDNNMSISENVGGMSSYLNGIRTAKFYNTLKKGVTGSLQRIPGAGKHIVSGIHKTKNSLKQLLVPGMLFEQMGITYLGPIDGHDVKKLYRTFCEAKKMDHSVLIHVLSEKGKGYAPAEKNPSKFHGIGPFDVATGDVKTIATKESYTDVFGAALCEVADANNEVVGITAAMKDGTGLTVFQQEYPKRFFDVGIAEGHAVTFAAGLAAAGLKPVVAVYSSFLQRAYDQIVHDVCMQKLPVIFAIDRAGLVGNDGETHQGVFDISFLNHIPNMTIMAPKNRYELKPMLQFATQHQGPIALRYPRGAAYDGMEEFCAPIVYGKSEMIYQESDIAILSVGHMMEEANQTWSLLKEQGYSCSLINARFVKPIDEEMIDEIVQNHKLIVTLEEGIRRGGYGESVMNYIVNHGYATTVRIHAVEDEYVEQGTIAQLRKKVGLDAKSVAEKTIEAYKKIS